MHGTTLLASALLPTLAVTETILGAYIFHRHGDRTSKSTPPTNLTALGYSQVVTAGTYFRDRYVASGASHKIAGLNSDLVKLGQLAVSAPADNVLMSSALGFSQALYPPVPNANETLRNATTIPTPMNGYQLIPVSTVSTGAGSEDAGWLQDATDCGAAETSSNAYFSSSQYATLLNTTQPFYTRLSPTLNTTFSASQTSFKNAYTIFDYLNVAQIHNASIPSAPLLDPDTTFQLRTLADTHELNLAYNASDTVRAIAGMQLAAQVIDFLNASVTAASKPKLGIQFGAYASFLSYFGLASLLPVPGAIGTTDAFGGVPDYASAMVWEVFSNEASPKHPVPADQLNVRFLFRNGTSSPSAEPNVYSLFNAGISMPWNDFVTAMGKISVSTTEQWCSMCGNSTGVCASYASGSGAQGTSQGSQGGQAKGGHLSNAVAGVIGAMVTLAVILLVEAVVVLGGGLRLVRVRVRVRGEGYL